ncbi:hypothetical protein [Cohnella sp.]|uniref:hypothetical protein n=1 Tax=Cohnella sp. TaxID=1883426 RepID=UPI0035678168
MKQAKPFAESADPLLIETFRALVEAICRDQQMRAEPDDSIKADAASQLQVHEYLIWVLDHSLSLVMGMGLTVIPQAAATATLLNVGASQFIAAGKAQDPQRAAIQGSSFASLSPTDRIRTLSMLENLICDLGALPVPYQNNGELVRFVVDYLTRLTMFGYYSEWSAYGTSRLATPNERELEHFPDGWKQVEYPGVALGYRALSGYLLKIERNGGESTIV